MPTKRKVSFGRSSSAAKRMASQRSQESQEQRQERLEYKRLQMADVRAALPEAIVVQQREADRLRKDAARAAESQEHRAQRLEADRMLHAASRNPIDLERAAFSYDPAVD